ncbi:MAG: hypothetical protein WD688_10410 [Candidatus Binatia bacterium]
MEEFQSARRWQITVCPGRTVHIHYGTGSLHILEEDFLELLSDLQKAAELFRPASAEEKSLDQNRLQ